MVEQRLTGIEATSILPGRDAPRRAIGAVERSRVLLVDTAGRVLGEIDKLDAHRAPGLLHLAFSVFLYRDDGRILLQRRSPSKYHFPSYWANACCSHPGPGEDVVASAEMRVGEELGMAAALRMAGVFVYRAECPASGLVEHELDHVLIGRTRDAPSPHPSEVAETCWVLPADVARGVPDGAHAPWLAEALDLAESGRVAAGW